MSFTFSIFLLLSPLHDYRIPGLTARKYGISATRTGQSKKSTDRRHAYVEILFPYKDVSSQTRMSTYDRTWADVENQLRANFGTEEGEQDEETVGLASRKIEKRSTMTFEGRRRSCLSLLRAFSAKIFSGRHARHLWNVLWHEKMLEKTTSLFWHGISRNCGCFGEENFFATFFVDGFDWIFKELSFFSFFFYKKWIFSFLSFDWRGLMK